MIRTLIAGTLALAALGSIPRPASAAVKAILTQAKLDDFVLITLDSSNANAGRGSAVVKVDQPPSVKGAPGTVHCEYNAWVSADNTRLAFPFPAGGSCAFTAAQAGFSIALTIPGQTPVAIAPITAKITPFDKARQPAITSVQIHDDQLDKRHALDFTVFGADLDPRDEYNQLLLSDAAKSTDADLLTASQSIPAGAGQCPDAKNLTQVVAVNPGYSLRFCGPAPTDLPSRLKAGLHIVRPDNSDTIVWSQTAIPMPSISRGLIPWLALLTTVLLALLIVALVGQGRRHTVDHVKYSIVPTFFMDSETDTYSLSKVQFMAWTAVALFAYAYVTIAWNLVQHLFGFPPFPDNFPGIIGLGAGTTIGSMAITSAKGPKGSGEIQPSWSDLVTSGGVVAADRAQYLLWTAFSVIGFALLVIHSDPSTVSGVPDIPTGLLTISGIGALGYLGGKLVRKPGPVIDEIAIEPAGPDPTPGSAPSPASPASPAASPNVPADRAKALADARGAVADAQTAFTTLQPSITSLPPTALKAGDQAKAAHAALDNLLAQAKTALQTADGGKPFDPQLIVSAAEQIHAAARAAAAEFTKMNAAKDANAKDANTAASLAQQAGLPGDKLAAVFKTLVATFQAPAPAPAPAAPAPAAAPAAPATAAPQGSAQSQRVITIRGRNLSRRGTFQIDAADLAFRMMTDPSETDPAKINQPQLVQADSNTAEPDMAAVLKLTIVMSGPGGLNPVDQKIAQAWFVTKDGGHDFTIVNPDGQKSVINYKIPPGESQK